MRDVEKLVENSLKEVEGVVTYSQLMEEMRQFIEDKYASVKHSSYKTGSQINAAKKWGISRTAVSLAMMGERWPYQVMLDDIGYEEHIVRIYTRRKR